MTILQFIYFQMTANPTAVTSIPWGTVLELATIIGFIVGIWYYYNKQIKTTKNELTDYVTKHLTACKESCTMITDNKIALINTTLDEQKKHQDKIDDKFENITKDINEIKLNIMKLATLLEKDISHA